FRGPRISHGSSRRLEERGGELAEYGISHRAGGGEAIPGSVPKIQCTERAGKPSTAAAASVQSFRKRPRPSVRPTLSVPPQASRPIPGERSSRCTVRYEQRGHAGTEE